MRYCLNSELKINIIRIGRFNIRLHNEKQMNMCRNVQKSWIKSVKLEVKPVN